jgi:signal transduction histidine kinase/CHASE3 domain sensor protein
MFAVGALVAIAMLGGFTTIWMVHRMDSAVSSVIRSRAAALNVSQELESALAMQRGLLSYYYIDGNTEWLSSLDHERLEFEKRLKEARGFADSDRERELLNDIESKYVRYSSVRQRVVDLYKTGKREEGYALHEAVRGPFYAIRDLCEQFKQVQYDRVGKISEGIRMKVVFFDMAACIAMICALALGVTLGILLLNRVLVPIRLLAFTAGQSGDVSLDEPDEVKALGKKIEGLVESIDTTRTELEQSREHLLQSEKLAQIGKLAAGVANSIRNPLTSVKMRLFSLERTLMLSQPQKEDFDVISEEIRHIDTIVGNFLEFSRPPRLKMQRVSPSEVVDMAVQLLRHRIESYGVSLELVRAGKLPEVDCDPEQLKEVLVNLIVNACEAMSDGGRILLSEAERTGEPAGGVVVISVSDTGPGIPDAVGEKIFEPFYTTKQEGTGLGLSIAARIIREHQGRLSVECRPDKGAVFTITLPYWEEGAWLRSL